MGSHNLGLEKIGGPGQNEPTSNFISVVNKSHPIHGGPRRNFRLLVRRKEGGYITFEMTFKILRPQNRRP